jgi:hypothetical protein
MVNLNGILGNASKESLEAVQKEFGALLIGAEQFVAAYKLVRDLVIFTNKRLILVDKQGITGSKVEIMSIPYRRIVRISRENAGTLDLDSELKLWVQGQELPIVKQFRKGESISEVYQLLSQVILE